MGYLTQQERAVLVTLALIVFVGSCARITFKKYPELGDIVNFIESDRAYPKVDVNTASLEELVAVPYIGRYTAQNIIEYRQRHGPFPDIESVKAVRGIKDRNYGIFSKYLVVSRKD